MVKRHARVARLRPVLPLAMADTLVQNETGYRNLTRLISQGYTEGQSKGYPLLQRNWLREASAGLIAL